MTDVNPPGTSTAGSASTGSTILITGGAGFIGSTLACELRRRAAGSRVIAFDNLRRRGTELALPQLRGCGVEFVHGDVRNEEDLAEVGDFDVLIDCSAEPSALAGSDGSPRQVLNINLQGTVNCLEAARLAGARVLFLSTSRVYPIARINQLPCLEEATRFRWTTHAGAPGTGPAGIREEFLLDGPRSFYGTSKLASEQILQEYHHACGMPALINRCGVIAGPGQMGKVDQGVVTLWVAHHYFEQPLRYIGFGGTGKQVRDLLHIRDLVDLIIRQMDCPDIWDGRIYNVGGGVQNAVSLQELTALCQTLTGRQIPITPSPATHPFDVRIFITDASRVARDLSWSPQHSPEQIVADTRDWIAAHEQTLKPILVPGT